MVMARLSWPRTSLTSPFGGAAAATGLGATWNAGGSCRTPIRRCRSNRVIRKLVSEYGLTLPANIPILLPFPPQARAGPAESVPGLRAGSGARGVRYRYARPGFSQTPACPMRRARLGGAPVEERDAGRRHNVRRREAGF